MSEQLEIPSGPPGRSARQNTPGAYIAWRNSGEGMRAWDAIRDAALREARDGATRISVNRLVEEVRRLLKVEVNNTFRAWIADDLVLLYPRLRDVIERRRRRAKL